MNDTQKHNCPRCGSLNIVYWEKMTQTRGVHGTDDSVVFIGGVLDENASEAGFKCGNCDFPIPDLDDYEPNFTG